MKIVDSIPYVYKNAPIPGGGYVTGLLYHPAKKDILYARTDIGGVYRFDYGTKRWKSLIDHVTGEDLEETYPIACALDPAHPERLYIASGIYGRETGRLSISEDFGEHYTYKRIPTAVHGNLCGRGVGYRLVVDKNDSNVLYFASQLGGLWKTADLGDTWEKLSVPEDYTTFVWVSEDSRQIAVGTAGYTTRQNDRMRGHSLYISNDGGITFEKLPQPAGKPVEDAKMNGLVAARYDYDGKYFYVTMNSTGRWNYVVDLGYSCDSGDVIGGKVLRYSVQDGHITGEYEDITPGEDGSRFSGYLDYGFGGISSCAAYPGLLVCSTLCKEKMGAECVYRSEDYGDTWQLSLRGLEEGDIYFNASYMKPQYNGNVSILHWLSDIKLNPFNPNEVWFNSGTGVFTTDAFLSDHPRYHDHCDGIEETVHLNVYGPLAGDVKLVDIVGDLGGFAFRELDKPCENSFDDAEGNRYITCINADLSDADSDLAIITARGNWKGKTKGGLVRTTDGFHTYERIPMFYGINEEIDAYMRGIEQPNVNPGWVAMSPNGENIVWSIADGLRLPNALVIASGDRGKTFRQVKIRNLQGEEVTDGCMKVYSDRLHPQLFYGFGRQGELYVSTDGGENFRQKQPIVVGANDFPKSDFGLIDTANKAQLQPLAGRSGIFYLALAENGLWKYHYDAVQEEITCQKLSAPGDTCLRVGLGLGRPGGDYLKEEPAIYLCGNIDGIYGFFRTSDECKTYVRLNGPGQMYGEINSMDGDKNTFGRFFLATGSRGVLYGVPREA